MRRRLDGHDCKPAARGFTLVELLVVIAVIALLVSILIPSLQAAKDMAKQATCKANMRSVGIGILTYASANRQYQPPSQCWQLADHAAPLSSYSQWWTWADFLVPYFDPDACSAGKYAGQSVGEQPGDGVYAKSGTTFRRSKRMHCPSQKFAWHIAWVNNGVPVYDYSYGTWHYAFNNYATWNAVYFDNKDTPFIWGTPVRTTDIGQPQSFCRMMDGDNQLNNLGFMCQAANWYYSSQYQAFIDTAPHRKTVNALMLDGRVTDYTQDFMFDWFQQSTRGYPFAQPPFYPG